MVFPLLLAAVILAPAPAFPQHVYTVAVVPQFPPLVMKRDWMPLIERISQISGIPLQLKFYRSMPQFEEDFLEGGPDFVYLNPYHAVMAAKAQGYIPLVRDGKQQLIGIVVVPKDSPIKSIKDLNGKTVVLPSPNAFAASLYLQALLLQKEKIRVKPRYVMTHSNVYRHVVLGKAAAGGGVNKTFEQEPAELRNLLKVIYRTPPVAPHPLCVHPRVAPSVREALRKAIERVAESSEGQESLKAIELTKPIAADYKRDYEHLEQLGLERFTAAYGK